MKSKASAAFTFKIALFYCTTAWVCQSPHAQSEIRFRQVHDAIIVVSMKANDQGPFDFILDTGADTTIVDPSLAGKLALASQGLAQQTTLAGAQTLTSSSLTTLAAGPALAQNLHVLVQDLATLRQMDPHIEGVAGQDFLSHFNYLLDYRKSSIRIEQDNEIRDAVEGDPVPIEMGQNRMLVASEVQSVRSAKLRLLVDSGANSIVLLPRAYQSLNIPSQKNGVEMTSSGRVELQVGRVRTLAVGSQQFHDITVALTATKPAEQIGDGLLPTVLFQALYVNNREGFIVFNPRSRRK